MTLLCRSVTTLNSWLEQETPISLISSKKIVCFLFQEITNIGKNSVYTLVIMIDCPLQASQPRVRWCNLTRVTPFTDCYQSSVVAE